MSRSLLLKALGLVVIAALIFVPLTLNRYGIYIMSLWAIMTIAAMGLNLTLGYAGLISLGHNALYAVGGYATAANWKRLPGGAPRITMTRGYSSSIVTAR